MKLSYLMMVNGVVGFIFGSLLLWVPSLAFTLLDVDASGAGKPILQLLGAAVLAYAIATLAGGSDEDRPQIQKLMALTRLISEGIGAFVLLLAVLGGGANAMLWVLLALYLAFTLGYIVWGIPLLRRSGDEP